MSPEQIREPKDAGARKVEEIGRAFGKARDQRIDVRVIGNKLVQPFAGGSAGNLGEPTRDAEMRLIRGEVMRDASDASRKRHVVNAQFHAGHRHTGGSCLRLVVPSPGVQPATR